MTTARDCRRKIVPLIRHREGVDDVEPDENGGRTSGVFAATLVMMVGVIQFLQGLVAVVDGRTFFVATPSYLLSFNATTWGWIHLLFGPSSALPGSSS
jgi:hypothetical protein